MTLWIKGRATHLRSICNSNLGDPTFTTAVIARSLTCVSFELEAGTVPTLSVRYFVFMSLVTFLNPAKDNQVIF